MSWTEDWLRDLLAATTPREIVLSLMRAGSLLLKAEAATFVPLAEWRPFLPPLRLGEAPLASEQMTLPAVRLQCRVCTTLHGGEGCQLIGSLDASPNLWCLPLEKEGLRLGVVNFFLAAETHPLPEIIAHLQTLQRDTWQALETWRRRQAESPAFPVQREPLLTALLNAGARALGCAQAALYVDNWSAESSRLWRTRAASRQTFPDSPLFWRRLRERSGRNQPVCESLTDGWLCAFRASEDSVLALVVSGEAAPGEAWRQLAAALAQTLGLWLRGERDWASCAAAAAAAERRRLAREIHDGLAQTLAFLQMEAVRIQRLLARGETARVETAIEQVLAALDAANRGLRQEMEALRAASEPGPFIAWLENFSHSQKDIQIILTTNSQKDIPRWMTPHLQRIVQEAVLNARRHAQAKEVFLTLREENGGWLLLIRDDGPGCACPKEPPPGRYGLLGMQERAESLGGDLKLESVPGQGLTVRLFIPFPEEGLA